MIFGLEKSSVKNITLNERRIEILHKFYFFINQPNNLI